MSRHFGPVAFQIAAMIFKVAEQKVVSEVDGVVADIAFLDHLQYRRPDRRVIVPIGIRASRLQFDHHPESIHLRDHSPKYPKSECMPFAMQSAAARLVPIGG